MAEAAIKRNVFAWEGTDKKGKKVKGETNAANPSVVKADLRRQGIRPLKVRKKSALFSSAKKKKITSAVSAAWLKRKSNSLIRTKVISKKWTNVCWISSTT